MSNHFSKFMVVAAVAGVLAAGCAVYVKPPDAKVVVAAPEGVIVPDAPPTPVFEIMPIAPDMGLIWIGGAYVWEGRWVWVPGHWERPPHPGAYWVPHRYEIRDGKYVFIRGGWR